MSETYWTCKGITSRSKCPECGGTLYNSYCHKSFNGKRTSVKTGLQCSCGYHESDLEGLEKLKGLKLNKNAPVRDESLDADLKGEESLFCDTEFLETILKKPIKKSEGCN